MHASTDALVLKMWMELFDEQQAIKFCVGWKIIEVIVALEVPLLKTWSLSPFSELKTSSLVPLIEAVQIRVPSGLTAMYWTSLSWAWISC